MRIKAELLRIFTAISPESRAVMMNKLNTFSLCFDVEDSSVLPVSASWQFGALKQDPSITGICIEPGGEIQGSVLSFEA
jgi:hypothetical protein